MKFDTKKTTCENFQSDRASPSDIVVFELQLCIIVDHFDGIWYEHWLLTKKELMNSHLKMFNPIGSHFECLLCGSYAKFLTDLDEIWYGDSVSTQKCSCEILARSCHASAVVGCFREFV